MLLKRSLPSLLFSEEWQVCQLGFKLDSQLPPSPSAPPQMHPHSRFLDGSTREKEGQVHWSLSMSWSLGILSFPVSPRFTPLPSLCLLSAPYGWLRESRSSGLILW